MNLANVCGWILLLAPLVSLYVSMYWKERRLFYVWSAVLVFLVWFVLVGYLLSR